MGTQIDSISPSTVGAEFYSLLDAVDSEFIADDFGIGTHTARHDFANHLKVAIFEGVNPSDSLAELAEKTTIYDELTYMAGSTFSRLTNDRDYRAVAEAHGAAPTRTPAVRATRATTTAGSARAGHP